MLDTGQHLATALDEVNKLSAHQSAPLDDLVALSAASVAIDELFRACTDELRADPRVAPMWEAIAAAAKLYPKPSPPKQKNKNILGDSDRQVLLFWDTFAGRFAWDFLPTDFLHALYEHWMAEQLPKDVAFCTRALSRCLKSAAVRSGDRFHTRARPGALMKAAAPLAARAPHWCHDGSDPAIYCLRRSGVQEHRVQCRHSAV